MVGVRFLSIFIRSTVPSPNCLPSQEELTHKKVQDTRAELHFWSNMSQTCHYCPPQAEIRNPMAPIHTILSSLCLLYDTF